MIKLLRRIRMTKFERAYIRLYNGRIKPEDFAEAAGVADEGEAWRMLADYRRAVMRDELPDPRDKYDLWRQ